MEEIINVSVLQMHCESVEMLLSCTKPVNIMNKRHWFNPLTADAAYIRVFLFYYHIKYLILNMLKMKCDINQQDL